MSSPPATSPPPMGSGTLPRKRPLSHGHASPVSAKKPKSTAAASRKNSTVHPLRQTSFPPSERSEDGRAYSPDEADSPSINSVSNSQQPSSRTPAASQGLGQQGAPGNPDDDDEDEGRDDYGETVLGGGAGGFAEDDSEKKKLSVLLDAFDDEQNRRYEAFRRANLNKAAVKKLANQVLSQSVTQNVGTVICGFSKVFTGEIVELALQIQKSWGHEGPLGPDHLREAWRRYKVERQGAVGFRGGVGGGSGNAVGGGPGVGDSIGGGVGRLFR